ncbi:DUF2797 domain-containing protein [Yinghuangia aomiensis]
MTGPAPHVWRPAGVRWSDDGPALTWVAPGGAPPRVSPLRLGGTPSFRVGADRRCLGVRRGQRRIPCPDAAELPPSAHGGQCPACQALDRSSSVAADTVPDDPQPYRVYLAYHGTETIKVGITAARRGIDRLLEQGALGSVFLAEGPLMAARRAESVLRTGLGLPERVMSPAKRTARLAPEAAERRAERLSEVRRAALASAGWPESLSSAGEFPIVDHGPAYGLPDGGIHPSAEVAPLTLGAVVAGTIKHVIGSDVYLATPHGLVLLDGRLLEGWALGSVPAEAVIDAALHPVAVPEEDTGEQLFMDWGTAG